MRDKTGLCHVAQYVGRHGNGRVPVLFPKMLPPHADNEERRLRALAQYRILDTAPEQAYNDIVKLVSGICIVPAAFISLVDGRRQWLKARIGVEASETPREISFCSHTIFGNDILVVPDALQDPRFASSPLVVDPPQVRFYAGVP